MHGKTSRRYKKQCSIHRETNQGLTQNTFEEQTNGRMWGGDKSKTKTKAHDTTKTKAQGETETK